MGGRSIHIVCEAGKVRMDGQSGGGRHWLDRGAVVGYSRIACGFFLALAVGLVAVSRQGVAPGGKPLGYDFVTFWAAAKLALTGHAAEAYCVPRLFAIERMAVPGISQEFAWFYPPPFFLVVLPLGFLPYFAAYFTFVLTTLAGFVVVLRRVVRDSASMWCLAGFSGLWINLAHGQNGFLTAGLAGAAILSLERRPALAGVLIGLLAVKPQLALLFPVALLAIGAWRTLAWAAVTATAFLAAGIEVLGVATLRASLASLADARMYLENGNLPWEKMPTLFAMMRLLGAPVAMAYAVHATGAVLAAGVVWWVWRRSKDWPMRAASLVVGTFCVSPYVFDYDLAWLALAIAWMGLAGIRDGWLRGERELLVAAWLLPFLIPLAVKVTHVQVGPVVLGAWLWMIMRRHVRTSRVESLQFSS